jgi:hypothetical protein
LLGKKSRQEISETGTQTDVSSQTLSLEDKPKISLDDINYHLYCNYSKWSKGESRNFAPGTLLFAVKVEKSGFYFGTKDIKYIKELTGLEGKALRRLVVKYPNIYFVSQEKIKCEDVVQKLRDFKLETNVISIVTR